MCRSFSKFPTLGILLIVFLLMSLPACRTAPESPSEEAEPEAAGSSSSESLEEAEPEESATAATCPVPSRSGSGDHRAGLVVTFGDGTTETICVSFSEDQINGYDLLQRSGLTIVSEFFPNQNGYGICKISNGGSDGCDYPSQECFCDSELFWAFWILENDETWLFSQVGVAQAPVVDGNVQGQKWGRDDDPPPVCTFEEICGVVPAGEPATD